MKTHIYSSIIYKNRNLSKKKIVSIFTENYSDIDEHLWALTYN